MLSIDGQWKPTTHGDSHISLDQVQSLVYVRFCFLLVLFYQDGTDEFVDLVFRSQLREFLTGFLNI